jgi:hypothetical protein
MIRDQLTRTFGWLVDDSMFNMSTFMSPEFKNEMPLSSFAFSFPGYSSKRCKYRRDDELTAILEDLGVDTSVLFESFGVVPPHEYMAYRDFAKYYAHVYPSAGMSLDWDLAKMWLRRDMTCCTNSRILSFAEVKEYVSRSTSSTAFFNKTPFNKKGLLFDHPDFEASYYQFVGLILDREDIFIASTAGLKIEVRPAEKIAVGKARAFVVSPVYLLILDHQLNLNLAQQYFQGWHAHQIGIGMSLFFGDYSMKLKSFIEPVACRDPCYGGLDVSGWDKGVQFFEAAHHIDVVNTFYQRYVQKSNFIPGADGLVDTWALRHQVTLMILDCPVIMARGEVAVGRRQGELSGEPRTPDRNTMIHKLRTFCVAIHYGYDYDTFKKCNRIDHTGDDVMFHGSKSFFTVLLRAYTDFFGYKVESFTCEDWRELDYLSTTPKMVEFHGREFIVPLVSPLKLFASLCLKRSDDDHLVQLQRLASVRILCFWDAESRDLSRAALDSYIRIHRDEIIARGYAPSAYQWPDEQIEHFYLYQPESVFVFSDDGRVDLVEFLRSFPVELKVLPESFVHE